MAVHEVAHKRVDTSEGGYANVVGDAGGETYRGISRVYHPTWPGWKMLDGIAITRKIRNARFTEVDSLVLPFYKQEYWDKICGDDIKDQKIAEVIYDFAITSGVDDAVKYAQALVRSKQDGIMGPLTLTMLNTYMPYNFLVDYCMGRLLHYSEEAKRKTSNRQFLKGWWKRVADFV